MTNGTHAKAHVRISARPASAKSRRNLVSAIKIKLVVPISISVDVFRMQSFEIILPGMVLWNKV